MNIFILDRNPRTAAQMLCDEHLNKMILESAQMLSTVANGLLGKQSSMLYSSTYEDHPCVQWLKESGANCLWLGSHALTMDDERCYRFGYREAHKAIRKLRYAMEVVVSLVSIGSQTPFANVTPEISGLGVVIDYRDYYFWKHHHQFRMHWTKRDKPEWFVQMEEQAKRIKMTGERE